MGFLVSARPLPFVGAVRYLATPTADSTLAIVSLSLTNEAFSFRRASDGFVAEYRVEIAFRARTGATVVTQADRNEAVWVGGFQETLRTDESVIFQHLLKVPPGDYVLSVVVRDRNSPAHARIEQELTVPRFAGVGLATPLPIYEGEGRTRLNELPRLLLNPRATSPYGGDTLRFYIEAYRVSSGTRVAARAIDATDAVVWDDTIALGSGGTLTPRVITVIPARLPLGRARLELEIVGRTDTTRAPLLISLSDRWVVTNFEQVTSVLRYFEAQDWVARLRDAPPLDRPQVWRDFWRETDPVPITPENEALTEYFRRVQVANDRFREEGEAGWLTDRGEVFITLGKADEAVELSPDQTGGRRLIKWVYNEHRLTLFYQDQGGFGRYRLTPASRADYQRVLARVRRSQ